MKEESLHIQMLKEYFIQSSSNLVSRSEKASFYVERDDAASWHKGRRFANKEEHTFLLEQRGESHVVVVRAKHGSTCTPHSTNLTPSNNNLLLNLQNFDGLRKRKL